MGSSLQELSLRFKKQTQRDIRERGVPYIAVTKQKHQKPKSFRKDTQ